MRFLKVWDKIIIKKLIRNKKFLTRTSSTQDQIITTSLPCDNETRILQDKIMKIYKQKK